MEKTEKTSKSYMETARIAAEFAQNLRVGDIVLLRGGLGAGKTCFVNGILDGLGFSEGGCSPTFTIVNQYPSVPSVNHFDLYRIESAEQLYDIGFSEYLDNGGITVIEWPEIAGEILAGYKVINVRISMGENEDERIIKIGPAGTF
jgi:tRNA threonylcarbamoyladenosine biosynthesis protein TsaE